MKKIIALFCCAVTVFLVVTLSACAPKDGNNEEKSISIYQRSKNPNYNSVSSNTLSIPFDVLDDSISTTSSNSNNSVNSTVSQSQDSSTTQSSSTMSYSSVSTDSSTTPTSTNSSSNSTSQSSSSAPTDSENTAVNNVITRINNVGTLTEANYASKGQLIEYAEAGYNNLSAQDKALVTNYQQLVQARADYNRFVAEQDQKAVAQFKQTVAALSYAYNATFKASLDEALSQYAAFTASQQTLVAQEKAILDGYAQKYNDQKVYESFMAAFNALPSSINDTNVGEFKSVINTYKKLTAEQKAIITDPTVATKIAEFEAEIAANPAYNKVYAWSYDENKTNAVNGFKISGSTNSKSAQYEGKNYKVAIKINSSSTFVAPHGGTLKVYCMRYGNKASYNLSVKLATQTIATQEIGTGCEILYFELPSAGTYTFLPDPSGYVQVHAMEFSA